MMGWPLAWRAAALLGAVGAGHGGGALAASADFADETWRDDRRGRELPVRIRAFDPPPGAPLLLFSHGLGGSRAGGAQWADHWARGGYVVVTVQHPGSDESIWHGEGRSALGASSRETLVERMRQAANGQTFLDRVNDVRFVISEALARRARGEGPFARIDPERIGMSGHSFGAVTTQAICGQRWEGHSLADPRVKAGIAFSPSPARGRDAREAFAGMTLPMLLVTGTLDGDVLGNGKSPEVRREAFDLLPAGQRFLLVLDGATHMTFNGAERQNAAGDGPHFRDAVDAITLAFWNAELRGDAKARAWLADGARDALARGDVFEAG